MKNRKFTWIDGLVIAVLVLLVAGTCVKFLYKDPHNTSLPSQQLQYQVSATGVRQETVDILQVGDPVYESSGAAYMGIISDIQVKPAVTYLENGDGTLREVEVEDRYDLVITLTAEGVDHGDHYQIGTFAVRINRPGVCYTRYTVWGSQILSMG